MCMHDSAAGLSSYDCVNCTICTVQAALYQEDFLQERRDREAFNDQLHTFKEESAIKMNRLQLELNETKEKLVATDSHIEIQHLREEIAIIFSQTEAYKKQLDACKKELDEERERGQVMQDRIETLDALQEEKIAEVYVCA